MLRKNSSEAIVCAKCRTRKAIKDFEAVPVCAACDTSSECTLTSVASTGDIHGKRTVPVRPEGSGPVGRS